MKILKKFFFILISITLVGCSSKISGEEYSTIQEKLLNMKSYSCIANVTFYSNKGESTYNIIQQAKKDGKYSIKTNAPENVKGNVIIYDGNLVWQYNPDVKSKISIGDKDKLERKEICLFTFLENHIKSKDVALETSKVDNNMYLVLEAKIPQKNKYFSSEKLWINNKTKLPEKLIIYDEDNKERVKVEYLKFTYNPQIEDSEFDVENVANPEKN